MEQLHLPLLSNSSFRPSISLSRQSLLNDHLFSDNLKLQRNWTKGLSTGAQTYGRCSALQSHGFLAIHFHLWRVASTPQLCDCHVQSSLIAFPQSQTITWILRGTFFYPASLTAKALPQFCPKGWWTLSIKQHVCSKGGSRSSFSHGRETGLDTAASFIHSSTAVPFCIQRGSCLPSFRRQFFASSTYSNYRNGRARIAVVEQGGSRECLT